MMKTADRIIYIIRHGKPEGAAPGKQCLGITDVPLSEEGRAQADARGAALREILAAAEPGSTVRIISSPLSRCLETARIIGRHFPNTAIEIDPDLKEIDMGIWEGRLFDEIRDVYPEEYEARGKDFWNYRVPGGESFSETGERFRSVIEKRVRMADQNKNAVVIVSHAGAILSGISLLTGIPFEELRRRRIPYAGIVKLLSRKEETGGFVYEIDEN